MRIISIITFIFFTQIILAQPAKSLQEAELKKQIDYSVYGKRNEGTNVEKYQSIEIRIKNISKYKLKINVLPGTVFHSQHE